MATINSINANQLLATTASPAFAGLTVGSGSGLVKLTSGVVGAASAGTDYLAPTGSGASLTGIVGTQVANTPAGNIAATTVQAAINELDTEKASITYVDGLVVGLLDDRGSYDASVNTFPAAGGSGTAGAILKGDLWYISVAGTLGGVAVTIGDSVRALVDTPGQTAGSWSVLDANIGYVPENVANKVTSVSGASTDVQYPSAKLVYDQLLLKANVGSGMTWAEVTGTTQAAAINTGYITNNAALVTVTLPATAALGSVVRISGKGAGGWLVAQNASQLIKFGTSTTTTGTGGSLASTVVTDTLELLCTTADTTFTVLSSVGNVTVV